MKRCMILLNVVLLLLAGCGQETAHMENPAIVSDGRSVETTYATETRDTGITPEYQPQTASFALTEDNLYFVDRAEGVSRKVCALSLQSKENSIRQILQIEDGHIETMAVERDETGDTGILLMGKDDMGIPFLSQYTEDGQLVWKMSYGDQLSELEQQQVVLRLVKDKEGHYFAMCMEGIWLFDETGNYQGEIICPGKSYRDICADDAGGIYVTYQDARSGHCVLAQVQYQGKLLTGEVRTTFSGVMWMGENGSILMGDNSTVYAYMPQKEEAVKLLDLAEYHLTGDQVRAVRKGKTGEILLVTGEEIPDGSPVLLTRLYESGEEQKTEEGKQIITLLLPDAVLRQDQTMGAGEFSALATEFNRQSERYEVVLEGIPMENGTDAYAAINTRLLARESADLIYLQEYKDIERYMAKGFLEDLTPYIERSDAISREEYLEAVLQCYTIDDSLYSIPVSFSIDTLGGKISEMGAEPGWTTDEFLNWLKEHPDVQAEEGLTKIHILTYCLMGSLEEYIDQDSRQGEFTGKSFQRLLENIDLLQVDPEEHWDDWVQRISTGDYAILDRYDVYGFLQCSSREEAYGEALVYKGYPSGDGNPCYIYSASGIGILSRSSCKEGAYAFWEYYLLHHSITPNTYYTNKTALEDSMTNTSQMQYAYDEQNRKVTRYQSDASTDSDDGLQWIPYMSAEQKEKQLAMMEYVQADTLENQIIRSMILEEADYYFQGIKDLEETCRMIQSRVQLYLDETR